MRFGVERVEEVQTDNGKRVLLAERRDSGLGASHPAVVDPDCGEVFALQRARLASRRDDLLVLGYYRDEDWEAISLGPTYFPHAYS